MKVQNYESMLRDALKLPEKFKSDETAIHVNPRYFTIKEILKRARFDRKLSFNEFIYLYKLI